MFSIMKTTGSAETGPQKVGARHVGYATGLNAAFVSALGADTHAVLRAPSYSEAELRRLAEAAVI